MIKLTIVSMFVAILAVFASVAHGSTLHVGTYHVDAVQADMASVYDVRTLATRTVHLTYHVVPGATVMVLATVALTGHVDVARVSFTDGSIVHGSASLVYKGAGTRYKGVGVTIGAELGTHGTWTDTSDVIATDAEYVASRCESVGPRLDGTFVTICDGLVISVDDGVHAHLMPFGMVAGNDQIGRR